MVAGDILDYDDFFVEDAELVFDEKAFQKRIIKPENAISLLEKFKEFLAKVEPFDPETLESSVHQFAEQEEIKIGQIIHAMRVGVSGKAVGFGMFDTMAILGKEKCLVRIGRTLDKANDSAAK